MNSFMSTLIPKEAIILAALTIWALAPNSWACTPGPPNYACSTSSTSVIQTPTIAPFSGAIGVNTIKYDTSLNPSGTDAIIRATDANTIGSGVSVTVTPSGGDNDNIFNTNSTMFTVTNGGCQYVLGFNPSTMQVTNPVPTAVLCGQFTWSRTNPNVAYRLDSTGKIKKDTFTSPTSFTETLFYDFSTCSALPSPLNVTWTGALSVTSDDKVFVAALSNAGAQGTGVFAAALKVGSGCSVWNTKTGGVSGDWGATGTVSTSCRFKIHDSQALKNGTAMTGGIWQVVSLGTAISGCSNGGGNGIALFWNIGTTTVNYCTTNCPGHETFGYLKFINISNPNFVIRPVSNQASTTTFFTLPTPAPAENHFSWNNVDPNDTNATVESSASVNGTWTSPYQNEVFAIFQTGTARRFGHNFITGNSPYFNCQQAIASISQDGNWMAVTSDMLNQLGSDSQGKNRCDVFLFHLQ